jgi:hypothetical protein
MVQPSVAGEDSWIVVGIKGNSTVTDAGGSAITPRPNVSLPTGARIKVSTNGQMRLKRGKTFLSVERNSDIELRETSEKDRVTIFQRLGEIFLAVEPRRRHHFEVETPHLTAVVKGTEFTVAVAMTGSTVLVQDGAVEVTSLLTGQATLVGAGQTARVASELSDNQWAQPVRDDFVGTATPSSLTPGGARRGSAGASTGFSLRHMDLGDIGLTVGVALASILAMLIAISDAFAARCRSLMGRAFQTNRSKPRS